MDSEMKSHKVWTRFEANRKDGSIVKLRIQDLPKDRMNDLIEFIATYYIKDEMWHRVSGVYGNNEAKEEYKECLTWINKSNIRQIAICCLDNESEDFDEILAASTVRLTDKTVFEEYVNEKGLKPKTKEMKAYLYTVVIMESKFPQKIKEKYEKYYYGRGIVVHPDYRGLGIAGQILKQRRLLCSEQNVPMTCAWMTSIETQKSAERNGWETVAEVTPEELSSLTGLEFGNDLPSSKLMIATGNS